MIDALRIVGEFLRTNVAAAASTTLNGAINASTLTVTLTSGAAFAGYDAPLVLKIDSEYLIGARSSNTFTVDLGARGSLGSTAATHSNGATVSLANLYLAAGSQIWPDKLPIDFANTTPAVMFRIRGGAGYDPLVPATSVSIEFFCYGGSACYDDADAVARMLHDRFHGAIMQTTTSGTILSAHEEVAPQRATEPDTEWPRVFTAYGVELRSL